MLTHDFFEYGIAMRTKASAPAAMHMRGTTGTILIALAALPAAHAAQYPEKSVRVIIGLAAGGGTDISARVLTQKLSETLGQSFIVDNRPGAGSILGIELAAKSPPDGYTLLMVSPEFAVNPSLHGKVPYDAVRDFAPVAQVVYGQYFLSARTGAPYNSIKELIAYAKAHPRQLNYASSGSGSANHLAGELFKTMAGIEMVHVPYKGSGPSVTALLSGEVQIVFSSTTAIIQHVRAGRAKALAVTGPKRASIAPEIPTVGEAGLPGYVVTGWFGLLAPAQTPPAIVERLNSEINRVLPSLRERYAELGTELVGGTPREFGAFIKTELAKWARVVKASGAKPE
jgi:tripartite-type tricarboxylate transporter receptor subunit TctC